MDNNYYINKIQIIFDTELEKYKKFSLRDFIILNKEIILYTCKENNLDKGIELLSIFLLKLPANCDLQKNLIKLIKEYLKNEKPQN